MLRANPRILSTALFSALGLAPLGCGGAFRDASDDSNGGTASGGDVSAGTASGGKPSAGNGSGGATSAGTTNGGASSGGATTGGATGRWACKNPTTIAEGFERCESGTIHRPQIAECPSSLVHPTTKIALPGGGACTSNTECVDAPHGYCGTADNGAPGNFCQYGCVKDSECGPGLICLCGEPVGRCVTAKCTSDADCGDGLLCQSFDQSHGCGVISFACQTPQDSCGGDADCTGAICEATTGSFKCSVNGCAVGRPFLVEGEQRVACVVERGDWGAATDVDWGALSEVERRSASSAWARIAQLEHASVAAFARFALQLLQLGAPAELVRLSTEAMADETRHAAQAFGFASALAVTALGPGPLDVEQSLLETSLVDVVRLVVREGCVGETVAALEAREAAARARCPELARLLAAVADDEARHAALAWRFVAWALEQEAASVRPVVEAELRRAQRELAVESVRPVSAAELTLFELGIVPTSVRAELARATLFQVILPCGEALLAKASVSAAENQVLSA